MKADSMSILNRIVRKFYFPWLRQSSKSQSWQYRKNNSGAKVALIDPWLQRYRCRSILDIGCNAGQVSRMLSADRFVVGIDGCLDVSGFAKPFHGVALGNMRLTPELLELIPPFEAVTLLSVHHQWHELQGDEQAKALFSRVASLPSKLLFVEFAAVNSKFGRVNGDLFIDNDEASVLAYARQYLQEVLPSRYGHVEYLGPTPEFVGFEPFRYLFCASKVDI